MDEIDDLKKNMPKSAMKKMERAKIASATQLAAAQMAGDEKQSKCVLM